MARLLSINSQLYAARITFANMDTVSSVCLLNSFSFHNPSPNEIIELFVQNSVVAKIIVFGCSFDSVSSMNPRNIILVKSSTVFSRI